MAKGMFISMGGKARKVKKVYVGTGGVARKVKKAWVGVGGVARLCFSDSEFVFKERLSISTFLGKGYAGANSSYALFAVSDAVKFAYNSSLTLTNLALTFYAKTNGVCIGRPSHVIISGGSKNETLAIDMSLTMSTPTGINRANAAAANAGENSLIAGGDYGGPYSTVDVFDSALTHSYATDLRDSKSNLGGASIGGRALFAGGWNTAGETTINYNTVDSYNSALTRSALTSLSFSGFAAGCQNSAFALFAAPSFGTVNAYNASMTRSIPASLSPVYDGYVIPPNGISSEDFAVFTCMGTSYNAVNAYDTSLTRIVSTSLAGTNKNNIPLGATIGDSMLISDGYEQTTISRYSLAG